jgi:hypothetical protein
VIIQKNKIIKLTLKIWRGNKVNGEMYSGKIQQFLLFPKELCYLRLPDIIVLDSLLRKPMKFELPVLGAIKIFTFRLNYNHRATVDVVFDDHTKSFINIFFSFIGVDRLSSNAFEKLLDRNKSEELTVIKQALEILKRYKRTGVYCTSLDKRIFEINRLD